MKNTSHKTSANKKTQKSKQAQNGSLKGIQKPLEDANDVKEPAMPTSLKGYMAVSAKKLSDIDLSLGTLNQISENTSSIGKWLNANGTSNANDTEPQSPQDGNSEKSESKKEEKPRLYQRIENIPLFGQIIKGTGLTAVMKMTGDLKDETKRFIQYGANLFRSDDTSNELDAVKPVPDKSASPLNNTALNGKTYQPSADVHVERFDKFAVNMNKTTASTEKFGNALERLSSNVSVPISKIQPTISVPTVGNMLNGIRLTGMNFLDGIGAKLTGFKQRAVNGIGGLLDGGKKRMDELKHATIDIVGEKLNSIVKTLNNALGNNALKPEPEQDTAKIERDKPNGNPSENKSKSEKETDEKPRLYQRLENIPLFGQIIKGTGLTAAMKMTGDLKDETKRFIQYSKQLFTRNQKDGSDNQEVGILSATIQRMRDGLSALNPRNLLDHVSGLSSMFKSKFLALTEKFPFVKTGNVVNQSQTGNAKNKNEREKLKADLKMKSAFLVPVKSMAVSLKSLQENDKKRIKFDKTVVKLMSTVIKRMNDMTKLIKTSNTSLMKTINETTQSNIRAIQASGGMAGAVGGGANGNGGNGLLDYIMDGVGTLTAGWFGAKVAGAGKGGAKAAEKLAGKEAKLAGTAAKDAKAASSMSRFRGKSKYGFLLGAGAAGAYMLSGDDNAASANTNTASNTQSGNEAVKRVDPDSVLSMATGALMTADAVSTTSHFVHADVPTTPVATKTAESAKAVEAVKTAESAKAVEAVKTAESAKAVKSVESMAETAKSVERIADTAKTARAVQVVERAENVAASKATEIAAEKGGAMAVPKGIKGIKGGLVLDAALGVYDTWNRPETSVTGKALREAFTNGDENSPLNVLRDDIISQNDSLGVIIGKSSKKLAKGSAATIAAAVEGFVNSYVDISRWIGSMSKPYSFQNNPEGKKIVDDYYKELVDDALKEYDENTETQVKKMREKASVKGITDVNQLQEMENYIRTRRAEYRGSVEYGDDIGIIRKLKHNFVSISHAGNPDWDEDDEDEDEEDNSSANYNVAERKQLIRLEAKLREQKAQQQALEKSAAKDAETLNSKLEKVEPTLLTKQNEQGSTANTADVTAKANQPQLLDKQQPFKEEANTIKSDTVKQSAAKETAKMDEQNAQTFKRGMQLANVNNNYNSFVTNNTSNNNGSQMPSHTVIPIPVPMRDEKVQSYF